MYELQKWHPMPQPHPLNPTEFLGVDESVLSREDLSCLLNGRQALVDAFETLTEELEMAQCSCTSKRLGTNTRRCSDAKEKWLSLVGHLQPNRDDFPYDRDPLHHLENMQRRLESRNGIDQATRTSLR